MNNAIRHTWVVSVALFLSLFAALSLIQVALSDELNSHPQNARQTIANAGAPRGPITVDGSPIAESVPAEHSQYDYQRVYNDPELYSGITGFFSVVEGSPGGLEQTLNDYLSGQSDAQFFDRITSLFTAQTMQGAQVELTLDAELQRQAYDMIPEGQRGTIIVTDVTTGDVRAMVSKPTYDTNLLAVHSGSDFQENMEQVQGIEGLSPYRSRALNVPIAPGSTFKLVDTLAMLESGDYEVDTELDNPNEIQLPQSTNTLENLATGACLEQSEAEFSWIFANSCNTPFAEAAMELGGGFHPGGRRALRVERLRRQHSVGSDRVSLPRVRKRRRTGPVLHRPAQRHRHRHADEHGRSCDRQRRRDDAAAAGRHYPRL